MRIKPHTQEHILFSFIFFFFFAYCLAYKSLFAANAADRDYRIFRATPECGTIHTCIIKA